MAPEKYIPVPALQPFIKEFLILESGIEFPSKTIPDGSVVMAFRWKGKVFRIEKDSADLIPTAVISGLRKSARLFRYEKDTATLLVIFKEGGIAAFSSLPVHQLFELSVMAADLFPGPMVNEMTERLGHAISNQQRIELVEAFLFKCLGHAAFLNKLNSPDLLVAGAVGLIRRQAGIVRIKQLAKDLHISQDAFEKRFRSSIGASPKQYASIIRMRRLIDGYSQYDSLTEATYEAGYFDQSHFIKDFHLFTGETPRQFFRSVAYW